MVKIELIKYIHNENKDLTKKKINTIVNSIFLAIENSIVTNKKFSFPKFGTFKIKNRKARKGRNPRTGNEIFIKESKTIQFKPSKILKLKIQ